MTQYTLTIPRTDAKGACGPAWRPLKKGDGWTAMLVCPEGHESTLSGHQIAHNGTVSPSAECPDCKWHVCQLSLADWSALVPCPHCGKPPTTASCSVGGCPLGADL
jgi:hypothetical protein